VDYSSQSSARLALAAVVVDRYMIRPAIGYCTPLNLFTILSASRSNESYKNLDSGSIGDLLAPKRWRKACTNAALTSHMVGCPDLADDLEKDVYWSVVDLAALYLELRKLLSLLEGRWRERERELAAAPLLTD